MIGIAGAGAFGTALAITLARTGAQVTLWARDAAHVARMQEAGASSDRLTEVILPQSVSLTADLARLAAAEAVLLAIPAQLLAGFLRMNCGLLNGLPLVACAKGIDLVTLRGPSAAAATYCPASPYAVMTGPSFAADMTRGLPTALTLACVDPVMAMYLQSLLTTPTLRLYRTDDVIGAELGGALKNVIAIAAGIVIGAGLGESARAALITRGHAEMLRLALHQGARAETLAGLSGFGDLVLTCTSVQSRNFTHGFALGQGTAIQSGKTVEGITTAKAVAILGAQQGLDLPITTMVAALMNGELSVPQAIEGLLNRPLKQE